MVYPSHFNPGEYGLADPNANPGQTVTDALLYFEADHARVEGAPGAVAAGLLARAHVHDRRPAGAGRRGALGSTRAASCSGTRSACTRPTRFRLRSQTLPIAWRQWRVTRAIHLKTEIPGPKSRAILERKARVIADPLSIYAPVVIAEGHGATITDVDGNTFIDFTGGVGCLNVGHSHPRVVEAAQAQLERFSHTDFTIVPYEVYVELAERLTRSRRCASPPRRRSSTRAPRRSRTRSSSRARTRSAPR